MGISQAAFARAAGVPRSQLAIFETGGSVTLITLRKILEQLPAVRLDLVPADFDPAEAQRAAAEVQDLALALHQATGRLAATLAAKPGAVTAPAPRVQPPPLPLEEHDPPIDPALVARMQQTVADYEREKREGRRK